MTPPPLMVKVLTTLPGVGDGEKIFFDAVGAHQFPSCFVVCHCISLTIAPLLQASPSVAIVPLQHGGHDEFREGGVIEKEKEAVKTKGPLD